MSILYMVATPIGHLEDMTYRAVKTLQGVSAIFCEDTRHTKNLLDRYEIKTMCFSLHEHSGFGSYQKVMDLLDSGKDVAYVTDAGTPGISDPGGKLVSFISSRRENITIVPIPGASALSAILSVAGIPLERFVFMGFPPVKNKRERYFREVISHDMPVVFYESTYRLIKSLEQLSALDNELQIIVGGELTKKFEKIYRGNIVEVLEELLTSNTRGEFVIIVYKGIYA